MAPEVRRFVFCFLKIILVQIFNGLGYSSKVDIYAFGVMIAELWGVDCQNLNPSQSML